MFTRTKTVRSNGKVYKYVQLVQSYRDNGQPKQRVLLNLGREEEFSGSQADDIVAALKKHTSRLKVIDPEQDCHHQWAKNYGDIFVMQRIWEELKLDTILDRFLKEREYKFDVKGAVKAMVLNRVIDAKSKLSTYEWLKKDICWPEASQIELHHLYRALDFLIDYKSQFECELYNQMVTLLNYDTSVVFYDLSLVDMYGESPQLVQYSRKGRMQFLISLILSRDGLPLGHEVLSGNTTEIDTVDEVLSRLKGRYSIGRCLFVCDRGLVSQEKLDKIQAKGYNFIVGIRRNHWKEVNSEVLARPGRYRKVSENLCVKEVDTDRGRYIICFNPIQAKRDKAIREKTVEELAEEIKELDPDSKKAAELYGHRFKGRFLRRLQDGTLRLDKSRIREDERYDGKYILLTNDRQMEKEEIATTYKHLTQIERSFRSLKSLHDLEPVYHHADRRIRAHVAVCVLAHLLERVLEKKLASEGLEMTAEKALQALGRMKAIQSDIDGEPYLFRTEGDDEINSIFKALHYRPPSRVERLSD